MQESPRTLFHRPRYRAGIMIGLDRQTQFLAHESVFPGV